MNRRNVIQRFTKINMTLSPESLFLIGKQWRQTKSGDVVIVFKKLIQPYRTTGIPEKVSTTSATVTSSFYNYYCQLE